MPWVLSLCLLVGCAEAGIEPPEAGPKSPAADADTADTGTAAPVVQQDAAVAPPSQPGDAGGAPTGDAATGGEDASTDEGGVVPGEGELVDAGPAPQDAGGGTEDAGEPDAAPEVPVPDAGPPDAGPRPDAAPEVPVEDAGTGDVDTGVEEPEDPPPSVFERCVPGLYVGTLQGTLSFRIGLLNLDLFQIGGDVEFEVESPAQEGSVLVVDGDIEASDADGNPITAHVSGRMDCETLQLVDGRLSDGLYVREAFDMEVHFEGTVEASYEPGDVPRVRGTWETDQTGGRESGRGSFQAVLARAATE